jgi:hypothetical protein
VTVVLFPPCTCTDRNHATAAGLAEDVAEALDRAGFVHLEVEAQALNSGVWVSSTTDGLTRAQTDAIAAEIAAYLDGQTDMEATGRTLACKPRTAPETYSVSVTVRRPFGWTAAA